MKVKHVMTRGADSITPDRTVREAAAKMKQHNVGMLPVRDHTGLKGVLTDRDIVVRMAAQGGDPNKTTVGEIMSRNPVCCAAENNLKDVARIMEKKRIRRVIVNDAGGALVGVLSMDDLARRRPGRRIATEVLEAASARHV